MKKISFVVPVLFAMCTIVITGCSSLKSMKKNADTVTYTVIPEVLETHAGKVVAGVQSQFPAGYFGKKVILTVTPVLKYSNGETALPSYLLQGEKVNNNNR